MVLRHLVGIAAGEIGQALLQIKRGQPGFGTSLVDHLEHTRFLRGGAYRRSDDVTFENEGLKRGQGKKDEAEYSYDTLLPPSEPLHLLYLLFCPRGLVANLPSLNQIALSSSERAFLGGGSLAILTALAALDPWLCALSFRKSLPFTPSGIFNYQCSDNLSADCMESLSFSIFLYHYTLGGIVGTATPILRGTL
jgi:hypothetical protein